MESPTVSKKQQIGCYTALGIVAIAVGLYLCSKSFPILEQFWRAGLGIGSLLGACVFLSATLKSFREERRAFNAQLAKFSSEGGQFYQTDQGWLVLSLTGVGTSFKPLTTFWTDFSKIKCVAWGHGQDTHNIWWRGTKEEIPRVEQIDEPWLLLISDDKRGHFQFFTCPPKLEARLWFQLLKQCAEGIQPKAIPADSFNPNFLRNGGGSGILFGGFMGLCLCGLLLAIALPFGISDRFLFAILIFPNLSDLFSWLKRKPAVKPEAIARHFAALNGYIAPLVEHQVFGPANGFLFIGTSPDTLDILAIDRVTKIGRANSKAPLLTRDVKNLKDPGDPITKLEISYDSDLRRTLTLTLPTDHANRILTAIQTERPELIANGAD